MKRSGKKCVIQEFILLQTANSAPLIVTKVIKQFTSVVTHGEIGNTQTGSQNSIKFLRLQPAVTNMAAGRLTNREVEENATEPAQNEHVAETNYDWGRN